MNWLSEVLLMYCKGPVRNCGSADLIVNNPNPNPDSNPNPNPSDSFQPITIRIRSFKQTP